MCTLFLVPFSRYLSYIKQPGVFATLKSNLKLSKKLSEKRKNACKQHFLPFPQCFFLTSKRRIEFFIVVGRKCYQFGQGIKFRYEVNTHFEILLLYYHILFLYYHILLLYYHIILINYDNFMLKQLPKSFPNNKSLHLTYFKVVPDYKLILYQTTKF